MQILKVFLSFFITIILLNGCKNDLTDLREINPTIPQPDINTIVFQSARQEDGEGWRISVSFFPYKTHYVISSGFLDLIPVWSADKQFILYTRVIEPNPNPQIWKMNCDGSNKVRLTPDDKNCGYPKFSPDGKNILFVALTEQKSDINIMDTSGNNWIQITNSATIPFYNDGVFFSYPDWSPDGQKIVFGYKYKYDLESSYLAILNLGTNKFDKLTSIDSLLPYQPLWSPMGNEIIFLGNISLEGGGSKLFKIKIDGADLEQLTTSWFCQSADWSKDGLMIAYTNVDSLGGFSSIWTMKSDGSNKHEIIGFTDGDATEPSW
jgi:Tol biopolymer transport system component